MKPTFTSRISAVSDTYYISRVVQFLNGRFRILLGRQLPASPLHQAEIVGLLTRCSNRTDRIFAATPIISWTVGNAVSQLFDYEHLIDSLCSGLERRER